MQRQVQEQQKRLAQVNEKDSISQIASIDSLPKNNEVDTSTQQQVKPNVPDVDSASIAPKQDSNNQSVLVDSAKASKPQLDSSQIQPLDTVAKDSLVQIDSLPNRLPQTDSLPPIDSTFGDSLKTTQLDSTPVDTPKVKRIVMSPDSLTMAVQYEAEDSMIYDVLTRRVHLFGNAEVNYEQYNLKAGHIIFDFATNTATAMGIEDSTGKMHQYPLFDDKTQKFESRKIEFNFKSKKGKVYDASTRQGDGYLLSKATKFISGGDTTTTSDVIYSKSCLYTTCDHKQPHFGIRASKAKIIPNKLIVVGPSFLEIMGTPTPIVLPFGFFPITKNRRSGLILSTDLEFSGALGPGIRGVGFYFGLSEYWDLALTTDLYVRGSFRLNASSRYNKRYKFNGNLTATYSNQVTDEKGTPDYNRNQDFNIQWVHNQDPKAHPSQTFSANVNFGTSSFFQNTSLDAENILQSTFNSNVSYTKRFLGTPFSLSTRAAITQNTATRQMTIRLPQVDFRMNQIFPFKRKNAAGESKWYERIGFSYSMSGRNEGRIVDTVLFQPGGIQEFLNNMDYDITHSPRLNMSFKVFKYINVQPTVNYTGYWYFYANRQELDPTPVIDTATSDTTSYGTIIDNRDYGFYMVHDFSSSINLNTQIFATGTFNIGALNKIRAVFRPNVGFRWRPDYEDDRWNFYDSVQTDTRYPDVYQRYSRFRAHPTGGEQAALTFSLAGRLDARMRRGKRDTTSKEPYKKVVLINQFSLSGNYNFVADSLKLSALNFNANTTLFKHIGVTFTATFDPYAANIDDNSRINRFEINETGRLARLTNANLNLSTRLTPKMLEDLFSGKKGKKDNDDNNRKKAFQLLQSVNLRYNLNFRQQYFEGVDSMFVSTNEIAFSGGINLSKGWSLSVGRIGYDFVQQRITFPDFTFGRDLHCWQMGLNWQPERQTWNFFIRVKPGSLGFINIPQRKQPYDQF